MMRKSSWLLLLLLPFAVSVEAWGGSSGSTASSTGEEGGPETYAGSPSAAGPANTCLAWDTNPTACTSNQFVTDQNANGSLACALPTVVGAMTVSLNGSTLINGGLGVNLEFPQIGGGSADHPCLGFVTSSDGARFMVFGYCPNGYGDIAAAQFRINNAGVYSASSSGSPTGAPNVGMSPIAAGNFAFGNGLAGSTTGTTTQTVLALVPGAVGACGSGQKGHLRVAEDGSLCNCNGTVWTPTPLSGSCS